MSETLLFFTLGGLTLSVAAIVGAMAGQLYERRKWERALFARSAALRSDRVDAPPDRMERLEQAVDAMAIELERVGEGQRFVTKLLADRSVHRTPRSPLPGAVNAVKPPTA